MTLGNKTHLLSMLGYSPIDRVTSTWLNQRRSYRGRELFIYLKPLGAGELWLPQREMAVV
jgi:hypothetical protein